MEATTTATTTSPVTITINTLRGQTIAFTTPKDAPLSSIHSILNSRAPWFSNSSYILTNNSRRLIPHSEDTPVSTLLDSPTDTFIPLRLTVPLCGGKGGFGSILRAQGGRMSSRKKQSGEQQHGSSRNLDGRRLRTVAEAKALADYLAAKPDLEKKERDEKRKRWEDIVASTERKREDLARGERQARLDGKWVEEKEEVERKSREAVEKMLMMQGGSSEEEDADVAPAGSSSKAKPVAQPKAMFGWEDEDDEYMSDSEEDEEVEEEDVKVPVVEGKGKGKAV
jgi:hypothetical protein